MPLYKAVLAPIGARIVGKNLPGFVNYCRETKASQEDKIESSTHSLFHKEPPKCIVSQNVASSRP